MSNARASTSAFLPLQSLLPSLLLLLLLLVSEPHAAALTNDAPACAGETCNVDDVDAAELLQVHLGGKGLHTDKRQSAGRWVAMEGGGFRALGSAVGLVAGLLATKPGAKLEDVFAGVPNLSSNSGSSWFLGMLSYCENFESLVEKMALSPDNETFFYNEYFHHFEQRQLATQALQAKEPALGAASFAVVKEQVGGAVSQRMFEDLSSYTAPKNAPTYWPDFVRDAWLAAGANISTTLGESVNAWARGKVWAPRTSVMTFGKGPSTCDTCPDSPMCLIKPNGTRVNIKEASQLTNALTYEAQPSTSANGVALPNYIPASFTFKLGSGVKSPLQAPFVPARFDSIRFCYERNTSTSNSSSCSDAIGPKPSFFQQGGQLPVVSVIASSSATNGGWFQVFRDSVMYAAIQAGLTNSWAPNISTAVAEYLALGVQQQWGMWMTMKDGANSFNVGAEWWQKAQAPTPLPEEAFEEMADGGLFSLVDGSFTDNTAIAGAVADGATEVVAIMTGIWSLPGIFSGAKGQFGLCPGQELLTPVFAENGGAVNADFDSNATSLKIVGDGSILQAIKLFNTTVTTLDNEYWGLEGGRRVDLKIIAIQSTLPASNQFQPNAKHISQVAQSLLLPENSKAVETIWSWLGAP